MQAISGADSVRPAAVAGSFYPADAMRLRKDVADYLAAAPASSGRPKALIAPHAGHVYSGRVAAAAFGTLRPQPETIERVVLIGPAHYVRLHGMAVPTSTAFETPLGQVPIDQEGIAAISDLPYVRDEDAPHAPEHALEVELPFLQLLLRSFALVPVVIGDAAPKQVAEILARLWGGPETLIVISSDLSHYHPYGEARRRDAETAVMIEASDWRPLDASRACGFLAIAGLLIEAGRQGLTARRLALCNSGDTAGDKSRVVGYGAWSFDLT